MRGLPQFIIVMVFLLLVETSVRLLHIPSYIIPAPSRLAAYVANNWELIGSNTAVTVLEAMIGLVLALIFGSVLAMLTLFSRGIESTVRPAMMAIQSIPLLAIAPLVNIWLGNGFVSKAALAMVICLPTISAAMSAGLNVVPKQELELFHMLGATRAQVFALLRLPRSASHLMVAIRIAAPLSVLGAIVSEFVGANEGIGFQIMQASYYLKIDAMFSFVIAAAASSIAMSCFVSRLLKYVMPAHFEAAQA